MRFRAFVHSLVQTAFEILYKFNLPQITSNIINMVDIPFYLKYGGILTHARVWIAMCVLGWWLGFDFSLIFRRLV